MKDTEDSKQPKEVGCCDKKTEDKYFSFILVLANSYFLMRKKYILNLDQFSSAASLCCYQNPFNCWMHWKLCATACVFSYLVRCYPEALRMNIGWSASSAIILHKQRLGASTFQKAVKGIKSTIKLQGL